MKIGVCIKQVPVVSRIQFDYETRTMVREGVPLEVNSFDLLAVDRAVALARETAGEVAVFTMGPPQAREALVQCLAMGADRAVHLTDQAMAGSDTLATARSLALVLGKEEFRLILCGRNSTDAETGQVGPELAELLGLPYVGNVSKLDLYVKQGVEQGVILVERVTDEGHEVIECPLPALVSVTEGIMEERYPNRQQMEAAREAPAIQEMGAGDLSGDPSRFGAQGSPTHVSEIRLVDSQRLGVVIEDPDPQAAAATLVESLTQKAGAPPPTQSPIWPRYPGLREGSIWVVADWAASSLRRSTLEVLGKARELAQQTRAEVVALSLALPTGDDARTLAAYGADRIIAMDGSGLGHITGIGCMAALARAIEACNPYAVLFSATPNGRDLASRVAARLGLGLTGDCVDLEMNDAGELVQLKPALGGNVVAPILSRTRPYMATLRPGLLSPIQPQWDQAAEVDILDSLQPVDPDIKLLEAHVQEDAQGLALESARVVLGVGMGIGGPQSLPTIYRLAGAIGASVAASRNVTDAGWLPKQLQVGLTGRAIAPELYLAVGIRGDFNHCVGIQRAGTILAVNNNPNPRRTPILQAADFTIIGDWETYLPPLIEALKPIVAGGPG